MPGRMLVIEDNAANRPYPVVCDLQMPLLDGYPSKPFEPETLVAQLESCLPGTLHGQPGRQSAL